MRIIALSIVASVVFYGGARPVELAFPESTRYEEVKRELKGDWVTDEIRGKANKLCADLEASVAVNEKLLGGSAINYEDFKGDLADQARIQYGRQAELLKKLEDLLGLYAYATQADANDFFRGGRTYESSLNSWGPPKNVDELTVLLEHAVAIRLPLNADDFSFFRHWGFSSRQQAEALWCIVEKYREASPDSDLYRKMLNAAYWFNRFATDEQAERLKPLTTGGSFENRFFGHLLRQRRKDKRWLQVQRQRIVAEEMEGFFKEGATGGKSAFLERTRPYGASSKDVIWGLLAVADNCCQKPSGSDLERMGVMALEFTVPLEDIARKEERPDFRYSFIARQSRNECAWMALKCYYDYHERIGSPFGKWSLQSMLTRGDPPPGFRERVMKLIGPNH